MPLDTKCGVWRSLRSRSELSRFKVCLNNWKVLITPRNFRVEAKLERTGAGLGRVWRVPGGFYGGLIGMISRQRTK